jgi:hypothetical protein
MTLTTTLTRRKLLSTLTGGIVGIVAIGAKSASAASTVTMWKLNANWGTPLVAPNGTTRTRCKGKACHVAAPNRFFLTQADAIAGRLHVGCMAQPYPVQVAVDLNALMPYYTARFGGVDVRGAQLPTVLGNALQRAVDGPNAIVTPDATPDPESAPAPDAIPDAAPIPDATAVPEAAPDADFAPQYTALPVTGSSPAPVLIAGAAFIATGIVLSAKSNRDDLVSSNA